MLSLLKYNDKLLRNEAQRVDFNNPPVNLAEIIKSMEYHLDKMNLDFITANLMGIPLQIALVRDFINQKNFLVFNLKIVSKAGDLIAVDEGSPVYPGLKISIKRHESCRARITDLNGKTQTKNYIGKEARILQIIESQELGVDFISESAYNKKEKANREWLALQRKQK